MRPSNIPLPSNEYLLDEADERTIESYLAAGSPKGGQSWNAICDITNRMGNLLIKEGLASARMLNLPPAFNGKYHTNAQAWSTLAPPRRQYAFAIALINAADGEGLGQSSGDNPDWLEPGVDAFKAIAPEPIATELADYYEYMSRYMIAMQQRDDWPPRGSVPGADRLKPGLEDRRRKTDWTTLLLQHIMRNKPWFFRHHAREASGT